MLREYEPGPRSSVTRQAARRRASALSPAAAVALALQRGVGNHAAARVLARFTEKEAKRYQQASEQLQLVREQIDAVRRGHKSNFPDFKGSDTARGKLTDPLTGPVEQFAQTLGKWETTKDAAEEAELITQAGNEWAAIKTLRDAMFKDLGGADAKKGADAVAGVRAKFETIRREQEAEEGKQATTKAQQDQRRTELAAAFAAAPAGPAYTRPADDQLADFQAHLGFAHRVFSSLTPAQLKLPTCPLYVLTAAQLKSVENYTGGYLLLAWEEDNVPSTRTVGGLTRWLYPTKVQTLNDFAIGAEIYADWIFPNTGHGFTVTQLNTRWGSITKLAASEKRQNGRYIYDYVSSDEGSPERLIISEDRKTLVTCFRR